MEASPPTSLGEPKPTAANSSYPPDINQYSIVMNARDLQWVMERFKDDEPGDEDVESSVSSADQFPVIFQLAVIGTFSSTPSLRQIRGTDNTYRQSPASLFVCAIARSDYWRTAQRIRRAMEFGLCRTSFTLVRLVPPI